MDIRRLTVEDVARLRQFWIEQWNGEIIIVHGEVIRPEQVEGFVIEENNEWIGLVTFIVSNHECEITSLDSLREGQGIGSKLISQALDEERSRDCRRVFLITTNDNLNALGFYQRRGFELARIYRGAVNETRKLKPNVPLIGENNIPLRDEIELEMVVGTR